MIGGIRLIKKVKDLLLEGKSGVSTHLVNKHNLFDTAIDTAFFAATIISKLKLCYSMQDANMIKISEGGVSRDEAIEKRVVVFLTNLSDEGIVLPRSTDAMSKGLVEIITSEIDNKDELFEDKVKKG